MIRKCCLLVARYVSVIVLTLLTGACATKAVQTVVRENAPAAPQATVPAPKKSVRLGPGDLVDVFVWGYGDFSRRATVHFNGALPYPPLGEIPVAGKSVTQVEQEIRAALTDFIKEPIVRVSIATLRPQKVHVLGELRNPGVYALSTPNTTLVEAVGMAGGMTIDARQRGVVVVQRTDTQVQIHTVDFRQITREGNTAANLVLAEGDVVYVPPAYLADIAREARRITDIVATLLIIENATILFESFLKALTHSDTRPGAPQTTVIVR